MIELVKELGVLKPTENAKKRCSMILARCSICGTVFKTRKTSMARGVKSCGCIRKSIGERSIKTKHLKEEYPRLYRIWLNIGTRCNNKKYIGARNYSEKGIKRCSEWDDFEPFMDWALSHNYNDTLTIDRIDNSKGYNPSNCRWVTIKEQQTNTGLLRITNTTGYRGVSKGKNGYIARATYTPTGERKYLGEFDTKEDAAKAYDKFIVDNGLLYPLNFGSSIGSKEKDNHYKE